MKFEDLKLPDNVSTEQVRIARAVYDQMHAHYEAKLAEAKPAPEELFEHPDMPGKKFRRLKVGEAIQKGDWISCKQLSFGDCQLHPTACDGELVETKDVCHYYREVPAWRLPDPPPGQKWHRDDWTQDMLPQGYRPLLLGEVEQREDEYCTVELDGDPTWCVGPCCSPDGANPLDFPRRTRRPLPTTSAQPTPVEYVPLGPDDIQPGSVVRHIGAAWWKQVTGVRAENITVCAAGNLSWQALAEHYEILRPGSTTWEPCKKIKP